MKDMTKILRRTITAVLLAAGVLAVGSVARAETLTEAQNAAAHEQYYNRTVQISSSVAGANSRAITLYYIGTASEAVVSINATGITFYAPYNVADTAVHASDGQLAFATYATVGALCDQINTTTYYRCKMRDARRSDASARLLGQTAVSAQNSLLSNALAAGVNEDGLGAGFDIAFSTGTNGQAGTNHDLSLGITPAPGKRVILKKCDFNVKSSGTALPSISISGVEGRYEASADGVARNDSTQVWSGVVSSSITALTQSFIDAGGVGGAGGAYGGGWIFAKRAVATPTLGLPSQAQTGRVVVRVASDATTTLQTSSQYLNCAWTER